uniref:Uncharacterized protein n=1 Tax=Tanacetum cinerariifolium TaxID=118510 RepID=A0A6L2LW36_TANCI|nr:hypothetical protein [Tanacetum cinerariifolium]
MTKVIKGEFKKLEYLKINDGLLTCNTSLKFFHEEFNRMSRMDGDLFTYEVEISGHTNIPCDLKEDDNSEQHMSHESNDDMEYNPSNAEFTEWMIGFMNGIKMYRGYMKTYERIMEYGKNPFQLNIGVSLLIIKMDVQSGLPVAGKMKDIVMEGTFLKPT